MALFSHQHQANINNNQYSYDDKGGRSCWRVCRRAVVGNKNQSATSSWSLGSSNGALSLHTLSGLQDDEAGEEYDEADNVCAIDV